MKNKAKWLLNQLGEPRTQGAIALLGLLVALMGRLPL